LKLKIRKENKVETKKKREDYFNKKLQREGFPKEAVQVYEAFKDRQGNVVKELIGYKPQYIFERLNNIWGYTGWNYKIIEEGIDNGSGVVGAKVMLQILDENGQVIIEKPQWGNSKISKMGLFEAKKGAVTNAICKCAAIFDVGHEAYKGEEVLNEGYTPPPEKEKPRSQIKPGPPINEKELTYDKIKKLVNVNTGKLSKEELQKLITEAVNIPPEKFSWEGLELDQLKKIHDKLVDYFTNLK